MKEVESLFIQANRFIDNKNLAEAKSTLEEILLIEPSYGRAHNHLAWIYETELKDIKNATMHYKLAIKFSGKEYPVSYINYIYLLLDIENYQDIKALIAEARQIKEIKQSILFYQEGRVFEAENNFIQAFQLYEKSKKGSFDNGFIQVINLEIQRAYNKMNIFQKIYSKVLL